MEAPLVRRVEEGVLPGEKKAVYKKLEARLLAFLAYL